ncbi:MAG: flagellar hook-associated protein FlgK [Acidobacteriaceae bacterium]|nr:flagellar hook-associated protein FlgK [Acidobacteriaceae bacterium]
MGSLIGLLGLSRNALQADQSAINATANNIANQNTAGYTRQVVSFTATDTVSLSGGSATGTWVSESATSQRSRVLEQRLQQATSTSSAATSRLAALQSVEASFDMSATGSNASSTELGSALDGFFSSLTALSANPSDTATRSAVLSAASTLATAFNDAADSITDETATLNSGIKTAANQIDALTSQIATLNGEITSQNPDSDAGALEDQRQQALQQLSQLVGVSTTTTESNGLTVTLANGTTLVSGKTSYSVSTTTVDGNAQLVAGQPPTIQSNITGGSIGGMLQARDSDLPGMLQQLDELANAVGTAVNTQNAAGVTAGGSAGAAIFSLPSSVSGSARGISVALTTVDGIATAGSGEGAQGTTNALALGKLGSAAMVSGGTATDFYSSFIGQLGTVVSSATTQESSSSAALTQAQTQRDSLSAVSLDEEATALTQYQRSYEAAAKLFSIVNQMLASAINLGTQTSVS